MTMPIIKIIFLCILVNFKVINNFGTVLIISMQRYCDLLLATNYFYSKYRYLLRTTIYRDGNDEKFLMNYIPTMQISRFFGIS